MKLTLIRLTTLLLMVRILSSIAQADQRELTTVPSLNQVAENIVGKWRYGIFRVEYLPIDGSGRGQVKAAGRTGFYFPTICGPDGRGNMLIRNGDEEVCVYVEFVEGAQVIKFPPGADNDSREVFLYPVRK